LVVSAAPLQRLFETTGPSFAQWCLAAAVGASILVVDESGKALARLAMHRRR
jgi:hypothetical protein